MLAAKGCRNCECVGRYASVTGRIDTSDKRTGPRPGQTFPHFIVSFPTSRPELRYFNNR